MEKGRRDGGGGELCEKVQSAHSAPLILPHTPTRGCDEAGGTAYQMGWKWLRLGHKETSSLQEAWVAGDIEEGLSRLLDLDPSERGGHPMHVFVRTGKRRHGWMDWMPFPLHAVRCPTVSAPHDSGALLDSHGL